jgi:hypothetical protein
MLHLNSCRVAKRTANVLMLSAALPHWTYVLMFLKDDSCVRVSSQLPEICMASMLQDDWKLR